jgi:hypothetical protein
MTQFLVDGTGHTMRPAVVDADGKQLVHDAAHELPGSMPVYHGITATEEEQGGGYAATLVEFDETVKNPVVENPRILSLEDAEELGEGAAEGDENLLYLRASADGGDSWKTLGPGDSWLIEAELGSIIVASTSAGCPFSIDGVVVTPEPEPEE